MTIVWRPLDHAWRASTEPTGKGGEYPATRPGEIMLDAPVQSWLGYSSATKAERLKADATRNGLVRACI
ncbi:hypothetical protein [Actinomadura litoris]|uniref:hypothetical protein n=1 Tax=Actinomadura litoris TaxID=2678616 RepID=UPI001FA6D170|nr:hypothetical protein [Actinomadura litoris]